MRKINKEDLFKILEKELVAQSFDSESISSEQNLVESGVMDSLTFLNFFVKVEETAGVEIDITNLEPKEFTSIDSLVCLINEIKSKPAPVRNKPS